MLTLTIAECQLEGQVVALAGMHAPQLTEHNAECRVNVQGGPSAPQTDIRRPSIDLCTGHLEVWLACHS